MTFGQSIKTCFRKYVTFSGRAPRSEYWWFVLFCLLVSSGLSAVDAAIWGPDISEMIQASRSDDGTVSTATIAQYDYGVGPLSSLWSLATFLPSLAAAWRRLHDTGRPGWYILVPWAVMLAILGYIFASLGFFAILTPSPADLDAAAKDLLVRFEAFGPGLFMALILTVFAGFIVILVMLCQRTEHRENQFGPEPEAGPA